MNELLVFAGGAFCGAFSVAVAFYYPLRRSYRALLETHTRLTDRDARGRFTKREG